MSSISGAHTCRCMRMRLYRAYRERYGGATLAHMWHRHRRPHHRHDRIAFYNHAFRSMRPMPILTGTAPLLCTVFFIASALVVMFVLFFIRVPWWVRQVPCSGCFRRGWRHRLLAEFVKHIEARSAYSTQLPLKRSCNFVYCENDVISLESKYKQTLVKSKNWNFKLERKLAENQCLTIMEY